MGREEGRGSDRRVGEGSWSKGTPLPLRLSLVQRNIKGSDLTSVDRRTDLLSGEGLPTDTVGSSK